MDMDMYIYIYIKENYIDIWNNTIGWYTHTYTQTHTHTQDAFYSKLLHLKKVMNVFFGINKYDHIMIINYILEPIDSMVWILEED